ncbi:MAG TPA: hypothetical protein VGO62_10595 [Myxococcota bacterium]|jgi:hypothetical protein
MPTEKKRVRRDKPAPIVASAQARGVAKKPSAAAAKPRKNGPEANARFVGGPRNEHGTRVARRVTCSRCGSTDHIPYVPKDTSKALCRNCAVEVLQMHEAGVKVRMPTRDAVCNLCGTPFQMPIAVEDDGDPLCLSCLQGFTSWQGSIDTPFHERQNVVVEERLSGALIRKKRS